MRAERLQGAREALRGQWPGPITVTDVATGYGFYELGRFAVTYRTEFGESPSETLRRAGRPDAAEPSTEPKSSRRQ
jgi:transcriptional regulator GlxA family with amidase domain